MLRGICLQSTFYRLSKPIPGSELVRMGSGMGELRRKTLFRIALILAIRGSMVDVSSELTFVQAQKGSALMTSRERSGQKVCNDSVGDAPVDPQTCGAAPVPLHHPTFFVGLLASLSRSLNGIAIK